MTIKLCAAKNMHVSIPLRLCLCGEEAHTFHVYRLVRFIDEMCYILCTYHRLAYTDNLMFLRETTREMLDRCKDASMRMEMVDTNNALLNMYLVDTQLKYTTNNVYRLATKTKKCLPSIDHQFYHTMVSNNSAILETVEVAIGKVGISMCKQCNRSQFMDRGAMYC